MTPTAILSITELVTRNKGAEVLAMKERPVQADTVHYADEAIVLVDRGENRSVLIDAQRYVVWRANLSGPVYFYSGDYYNNRLNAFAGFDERR